MPPPSRKKVFKNLAGFRDSFLTAFKSDMSDSNSTILKGSGSGSDYALEFYVYSPKPSGMTRIGLSTHDGYLDMKSINQAVKFGHHTTWKVSAMEIYPSENLHSVPIDKRKCRFREEIGDLIMFKSYSQVNIGIKYSYRGSTSSLCSYWRLGKGCERIPALKTKIFLFPLKCFSAKIELANGTHLTQP